MATVPNPITWAPGNIPTASQFNTDVRDAITFFVSPPRVMVKNSATSASITPLTWTRLDWNQEDSDPDGIHGATTQRLIAVTAGRYFVTIHVQ